MSFSSSSHHLSTVIVGINTCTWVKFCILHAYCSNRFWMDRGIAMNNILWFFYFWKNDFKVNSLRHRNCKILPHRFIEICNIDFFIFYFTYTYVSIHVSMVWHFGCLHLSWVEVNKRKHDHSRYTALQWKYLWWNKSTETKNNPDSVV